MPKNEEDDIKKMLIAEIKWSEINNALLKKISRTLFVTQIFGWIKAIIILAPVVVGLIYLVPLINKFKNEFGGIAGAVNPVSNIFFGNNGEGTGGAKNLQKGGTVKLEVPSSIIMGLPEQVRNTVLKFAQ